MSKDLFLFKLITLYNKYYILKMEKQKQKLSKISSINAYELIKQIQPQLKSSKELDTIFSSISNESFLLFSTLILSNNNRI